MREAPCRSWATAHRTGPAGAPLSPHPDKNPSPTTPHSLPPLLSPSCPWIWASSTPSPLVGARLPSPPARRPPPLDPYWIGGSTPRCPEPRRRAVAARRHHDASPAPPCPSLAVIRLLLTPTAIPLHRKVRPRPPPSVPCSRFLALRPLCSVPPSSRPWTRSPRHACVLLVPARPRHFAASAPAR